MNRIDYFFGTIIILFLLISFSLIYKGVGEIDSRIIMKQTLDRIRTEHEVCEDGEYLQITPDMHNWSCQTIK